MSGDGEVGEVSNLEKAERIAEQLRQEPYRLFRNDCITKSLRLKKNCKAEGIPASVVVCLGLAKAELLGRQLTIPIIHGWGEIEGKRIETSRPLGSSGIWGVVPVTIKPVITIYFH